MRDTVVVLATHLALLEGVVDRALVVRARLLEHVVEQAAIAPRGASGTFAIWGDGEGLVGVLLLPLTALVLWAFLLSLLAPLKLLCGGLGFAAALCGLLLLALGHLAIEDGTDYFLAGGKVGGDIKQHVRAGGVALRELVHQVPARRAFAEDINDLNVGDAWELGALLGEA